MKQSLTKSIQSEVSARGVALQRVISVPAVIEDVRSAFFGLCVHAGKRYMCGGNVSGAIKRSEFGMKFGIPSVSDEIRLMIGIEAFRDQ